MKQCQIVMLFVQLLDRNAMIIQIVSLQHKTYTSTNKVYIGKETWITFTFFQWKGKLV